MMEASRAPTDATSSESVAYLPLLMPLSLPHTAGMDPLLDVAMEDEQPVGQLQRRSPLAHSCTPAPFTVLMYQGLMCAFL